MNRHQLSSLDRWITNGRSFQDPDPEDPQDRDEGYAEYLDGLREAEYERRNLPAHETD